MSCKSVGRLVMVVLGVLLLSVLGCSIAADALNPAILSSLGIDPGAFIPSPGVIVVAFNNESSAPGTFYAFESASAQDLSFDSRNFSLSVDPAEIRNEVIECPVGMVSPGSLTDAFALQGLAATMVTNAGEVTVAYEGSPLVAGQDFSCGDLIEVRVSATYVLSVQVHPGR